ncbi:unnamed protein product [Cuscuta campestris]|uniref:J domain-containing protein n=1 Tax=Cuscuta campestris TaxID=132261 RepID=A0A484N659_9ASTE|nr:unnamed protein product [Cuscuta campestris]
MDELDMLARDFGIRPGGKSAPMRSDAGVRGPSSAQSSPFFGGAPKYANSNADNKASSMNDIDYDSIFTSGNDAKSNSSKSSSFPVNDKPIYDDDIFEGMPGLKSKSMSSSTARFDDDLFASVVSRPRKNQDTDHFDDLLGTLGKNEKATEAKSSKSLRGFDDLLAGFGSGNSTRTSRSFTEPDQHSKQSGYSNRTSSMADDPFGVLETSVAAPLTGVFSDPLEGITNPGRSGSAKVDSSFVWGSEFDELDRLNGFGGSVPAFSTETNKKRNNESPSREISGRNEKQTSILRENGEEYSSRHSEKHPHKSVRGHGSPESLVEALTKDSQKSVRQDAASTPHSPQYASVSHNENSSPVDMSPGLEEQVHASEDIWITVSEVPLFTQPTSAPPPSHPPPPIPRQTSKLGTDLFSSHTRRGDVYASSPKFTQYSESPKTCSDVAKSSTASQLHELEEFAIGRNHSSVGGAQSSPSSEQMNANSIAAASAAAMKVAMDRAEAKFRRAKEVREREYAKAARSTVQLAKDEQDMPEVQDRELKEEREILEREHRQRVNQEEEQKRLERERERARQAVERATREARERAAAEARIKAERAAVEKVAAEARDRAGRAAVQKVQAEAHERAAAEARDREAQEKAAAASAQFEARRRAERAAVERAASEARERAAAAAAAAAKRVNQENNGDDLESFFIMGSRASSAPRPRASSPEAVFDTQFQTKGGSEGAKATPSSGVASNIRKASSTTNIVDDLSSIFGAAPSSGDFQEVEGESEERRRSRLERHQRTQERTAKALAEKNQRDLQAQREQEERHRVAEVMDIEIKRWAAGKEGNLRALLSTMQYVLWPECGWQPVSLTDLITGASVKKVYRKATLCIHPDKVQQKGATLQQKYIAEKVFDLLKEAWSKFSSEELF